MKSIVPGMKARLVDGSVGVVTDVLIDRRTHAARYLVLSTNGYFGSDVLAPVDSVWRVDDAVHLALAACDVAALPRFDHFTTCGPDGLCSRSAWRYGANRAWTAR